MVARSDVTIRHISTRLSYQDVGTIASCIAATSRPRTVRVLLEETNETSTAALARLVALRRHLRRSGGELRIVGLRGRAEALYEINRMSPLLPREGPAQSRSCPCRPDSQTLGTQAGGQQTPGTGAIGSRRANGCLTRESHRRGGPGRDESAMSSLRDLPQSEGAIP